MSELGRLRERIETLDREIMERVAERVEVARRIGVVKRESGGATLDPSREATVVRRAVESARELDLPEEPVRSIFWTLMDLCRATQLEER